MRAMVNATEAIAAIIRREVRLSAGIAEGQEFRCDWERVAAAVAEALELREEWAYMGKPYDDEDELDEWSCGHPIITPNRYGQVHDGFDRPVRRLVGPWATEETPK